jgi:hypothetical protein
MTQNKYGSTNVKQLLRICLWVCCGIFSFAGSAALAQKTSVASGAPSCSGMSLGVNASLNGFVPFPATNVWNTNIASAPVDPNSDTIVNAPGFTGNHLHPDFGAESEYGMFYAVVDSSTTPSVPIDVIDYASESDVVVAPYPANAPIEGSPADCTGWPDTYVGDSHVLVLDRAKCELYETFNTHRCNGSWTSSSETIWDMNSYESRPWGWTSADAAGLPIFPGLVRYDEIAAGAIKHAIRFTLPFTKDDQNGGYFTGAATHAAGTLWGTNNVIGMRIRLKASFDISGYSKVNQIILTAMKQYGMILADNGSYFFFQGVSDPRFNDDDLDNLKGISSSNFEVVQTTPEFPGYDSSTAPQGTAPVIDSYESSVTNVTPGKSVTFSYKATGDSYDFIDTIGPVKGGSVTITPTETNSYILHSTNAYGSTLSEGITVTVGAPLAATPTFAPADGTFTSAQSVKISSTTPSATIHYTTNGSRPSSTSPAYSAPIVVSSSETLNAIAVASGYSNSAIGSATYTITPPAATPTFSPIAGTYTSAQAVTIGTGAPSSTIHYTTDGSTPTTNSPVYSSPIAVGANETLSAIAVASGYSASAVGSAKYTFTLPAATPSFSPAAGTYSGAQTVTIGTKTPSPTIHYTINGSTPTTNSPVYTTPIAVGANETISAIAIASGYTASAEGSAKYTIALPAATPSFSPAAGVYKSAQTVAISTKTPAATIHYTTNGSVPTTSSPVYSSPITVGANETIHAIAVATGYSTSEVGTAEYAITVPAAAPKFSPPGGKYPSAQKVAIQTATALSLIFYTTDGSTPTVTSRLYLGPISVSASETVNAVAIGVGTSKSAMGSAAYVIGLQTAPPAFRPASCTYTSTQKVTISTATPSAAIYYTTDGSTPTTKSTLYSVPVKVSASETLNAIAVAKGKSSSGVGSAAYTIKGGGGGFSIFLPLACFTELNF